MSQPSVAETLRQELEAHGLSGSTKDLAALASEISGITTARIEGLLSGSTSPSVDELQRFADAFQTTAGGFLDVLLARKESISIYPSGGGRPARVTLPLPADALGLTDLNLFWTSLSNSEKRWVHGGELGNRSQVFAVCQRNPPQIVKGNYYIVETDEDIILARCEEVSGRPVMSDRNAKRFTCAISHRHLAMADSVTPFVLGRVIGIYESFLDEGL